MSLLHIEKFEVYSIKNEIKSGGFIFLNVDQITYCYESTYILKETSSDNPKEFPAFVLMLSCGTSFIVSYDDFKIYAPVPRRQDSEMSAPIFG